jgi:hypothetical protein
LRSEILQLLLLCIASFDRAGDKCSLFDVLLHFFEGGLGWFGMCYVQREREREREGGGFGRINKVLYEYVRFRTFFASFE